MMLAILCGQQYINMRKFVGLALGYIMASKNLIEILKINFARVVKDDCKKLAVFKFC